MKTLILNLAYACHKPTGSLELSAHCRRLQRVSILPVSPLFVYVFIDFSFEILLHAVRATDVVTAKVLLAFSLV